MSRLQPQLKSLEIFAKQGLTKMPNSTPYLCFYGDDFTGSTDALDALHSAGVAAVLVLDPSFDTVAAFPGIQAVGFAGMSRAMSPTEMDEHLPQVFKRMASLKPRIVHYKVCSTFDSSPQIGNIGHALELGMREFGGRDVPIVVGAPRLGRYVTFGNLFARAGSDPAVHRLDRHPVMSEHPVTPMHEADLCRHLSEQTSVPIHQLNLVDIENGAFPKIETTGRAILCDSATDMHLMSIGKWLNDQSHDSSLFCVGSSAVETALVPFLKPNDNNRQLEGLPPKSDLPILVVSGSCSPITARQIDVAIADGFKAISISPDNFLDDGLMDAACKNATDAAIGEMRQGRSVIVYTAHGASDLGDTAIEPVLGMAAKNRIGKGIGTILRAVVDSGAVSRVCVSGGDTSGAATSALSIAALRVVRSISPGAPLCSGITSSGRELEIALKGGQMGQDDYFCRVRDAQASNISLTPL
jgi:uncharacterized protein YgbK (DUF1537 family)